MDVLLSTAAGLLAADAFCKKRKPPSRRSSATSISSSSDSSSISPSSYNSQRRRRNLSISSQDTQSSSSTLEASISSLSSSSDELTTSESESTDSDSDLSSDTDSSDETVTNDLRLHHQPHRPDARAITTRPNIARSNVFPCLRTSSTSTSETSSSNENASRLSPSSTDSDTSSPSGLPSTISPITPLPPLSPTASALQSRLSTFLPAIRASNAELEHERLAGTLEDRDIENLKEEEGDEKQPYIEMDLGLGVLEEKGAGDITPIRIKRERSRESDVRRLEREEGDVLGRLLGRERGVMPEARERKRRRVGIEVVD
ncbi:MAG: hypothetical protein Q9166_005136 [cf. Caloplaca sp. 2 TL-2023]